VKTEKGVHYETPLIEVIYEFGNNSKITSIKGVS